MLYSAVCDEGVVLCSAACDERGVVIKPGMGNEEMGNEEMEKWEMEK